MGATTATTAWLHHVLLAAAAVSAAVSAAAPAATAAGQQPWMNAALSPDERVKLLLPKLSIDEKVNQLLHVWGTMKDNDVLKNYVRPPPALPCSEISAASHLSMHGAFGRGTHPSAQCTWPSLTRTRPATRCLAAGWPRATHCRGH